MKKSIQSSSSNFSHSRSKNAKMDFEEIIHEEYTIEKVEKSRNSKAKDDIDISFPIVNNYHT